MGKKAKKKKPRAHGTDGRNKDGKFKKGNQCAIGNKSHTNEKAKALKQALLDVVTEKDIIAVGKKMLSQAKAGDNYARKELFDRLWGRALQEVDIGENAVKSITDILAIVGIGDASSNS